MTEDMLLQSMGLSNGIRTIAFDEDSELTKVYEGQQKDEITFNYHWLSKAKKKRFEAGDALFSLADVSIHYCTGLWNPLIKEFSKMKAHVIP